MSRQQISRDQLGQRFRRCDLGGGGGGREGGHPQCGRELAVVAGLVGVREGEAAGGAA